MNGTIGNHRGDATRIAVLGQSLGGVTVIALTRKNCCRDDRVRASILVDALTTFGGSFGSDPITAGPPTLIMHGTADATVAISSSVTLYNSIAPPRFFLGILGAGHSDAVESQADPPIHARDSAERATIAFLNAQFRGDGAGLAQTLSALQAEGDTAMSDPTP